MMRTLRLLALYVHRELLQILAWRGFLFTLVINQAVTPLLGLALWSAALPGDQSITGYYVALLLVQLVTVSYENHTFANNIYAGGLAADLLRPHAVVLPVLGINLALRILHLLIGLPLLVALGMLTGFSLAPAALLPAIPALVLAAILRFLFTYTLALTAFWSERAHGMVGLGELLLYLLGGVAAPTALFPEALRPLVVAFPFRAMLGFPAEVAAGSLNMAQLVAGFGGQIAWIAVFVVIAGGVWRTGVRRYTAVGG